MRGNFYRSGKRTGSVLLAVGTALAFGLAVVLATASTALAKPPAVHGRSSAATASHATIVKLARHSPSVIARTAGHKIS